MITLQGTLSQPATGHITQENTPENSGDGFAMLLEAMLTGIQENIQEIKPIIAKELLPNKSSAPDLKIMKTLLKQIEQPQDMPGLRVPSSDLQKNDETNSHVLLEELNAEKETGHILQQKKTHSQNEPQEGILKTTGIQLEPGSSITGLHGLNTEEITKKIIKKTVSTDIAHNAEKGNDAPERFIAGELKEQAMPKLQQDRIQVNIISKDGQDAENKGIGVFSPRVREPVQQQELVPKETDGRSTELQMKEEKESTPVKNTAPKSIQPEIRNMMFEQVFKEKPAQEIFQAEEMIKIQAKEIQEEFPRIVKARLQEIPEGKTGREFLVELEPKELGRMLVKLVSKEGVVSVKIFVEHAEAKSIIDSNIHSLRQTFFEQGIKYGRLDVEIQNQFSGSSYQQQPDWSEKKQTSQRFNWRDNLYEETETVPSYSTRITSGLVDYFA